MIFSKKKRVLRNHFFGMTIPLSNAYFSHLPDDDRFDGRSYF